MILLSFTELSVTGADYGNIPLGQAKMHSLHAISLILLLGYPFFQLSIYFHAHKTCRPIRFHGSRSLINIIMQPYILFQTQSATAASLLITLLTSFYIEMCIDNY